MATEPHPLDPQRHQVLLIIMVARIVIALALLAVGASATDFVWNGTWGGGVSRARRRLSDSYFSVEQKFVSPLRWRGGQHIPCMHAMRLAWPAAATRGARGGAVQRGAGGALMHEVRMSGRQPAQQQSAGNNAVRCEAPI